MLSAWFLGMLSVVRAAGTVHIHSNCPGALWYASVPANRHVDMGPLPADGYSESYYLDNTGVSIKLSPTSSSGSITQLEYTWNNSTNMVFYDMSNIDGNPFATGGAELIPSVGPSTQFPNCTSVVCPAGATVCHAAYNLPDDVRTTVCSGDTDLSLTLCPNSTSPRVKRSHVARHLRPSLFR